ncbi:MAG: alpha/beta hydrolase, partial [Acidobacteria bacterium]|nr:alpha/beta hydrolase [Acidobacteriota bacterium]
VIIMGAIMSLASCNLQNNMLYYPDPSVPSDEELAVRNLRFWPSGPAGYRGFIGATEIAHPKGTVIVFHGNAGTAADREFYVAALGPLGYRVILAEYPAYGKRDGKLGEQSFLNDAKETVRLAPEQYGSPIFLLGESLGCGVAAGLAGDSSLRIDGVLLITPWDTLLAAAKTHFPWVPVGLFLKDKYDSVGNLKSYSGRVGIVGAGQDDIVPIRHATALYESRSGDKRMWIVQGAGHNDWMERVGPSQWREWMDYVRGERAQ